MTRLCNEASKLFLRKIERGSTTPLDDKENVIEMSQATKALDDFSRKERARNIRSALICLVFIVVILFAGFLFSVGEIKQVQGTTKGLYGHPGDQGESMFLLVRLDDGKDVKFHYRTRSLL